MENNVSGAQRVGCGWHIAEKWEERPFGSMWNRAKALWKWVRLWQNGAYSWRKNTADSHSLQAALGSSCFFMWPDYNGNAVKLLYDFDLVMLLLFILICSLIGAMPKPHETRAFLPFRITINLFVHGYLLVLQFSFLLQAQLYTVNSFNLVSPS